MMAGMMDDKLKAQMAEGPVGGQDQAGPDQGQDQPQDDTTVADDAGQEQASPEEQAQKDHVVDVARQLMFEGGQVRPFILELLDDDPKDLKRIFGSAIPDLDQLWPTQGPIIALAATGVVVMLEAMKKLDQKPEGFILFHAGADVLEDLAEVSRVAGKHEFTQDEINGAMWMGADLFREAAADQGLVNLDTLKQEFDEIVTADKAGKLGEIMPSLQRRADEMQQQGGTDQARISDESVPQPEGVQK